MSQGFPTANKIMVVDDSEDNRRVLAMLLASEGYQISEASTGEQALNAVASAPPDLILLDVNMPRMNGYQVCEQLKKNSSTAKIPVIFVTAVSGSDQKLQGLELGAADYVTKPFDRKEIIARIKRHLSASASPNGKAYSEEDRRAAAAMQQSLLPTSFPLVKGFEVAWRSLPCERIAGDIFNVFRLDESHVGLYIVDVSGGGLASTIAAASLAQVLQPRNVDMLRKKWRNEALSHFVSPAEILETVDRDFPFERYERYFTIVYCIFNMNTGMLQYSNAAHPHPVVIRKDGSHRFLDKGGSIVGLGKQDHVEEVFQLEKGDRVYLFSDGLIEAKSVDGTSFGEARLLSLLKEQRTQPIATVLDSCIKAAEAFSIGKPFGDDISILGFEYAD